MAEYLHDKAFDGEFPHCDGLVSFPRIPSSTSSIRPLGMPLRCQTVTATIDSDLEKTAAIVPVCAWIHALVVVQAFYRPMVCSFGMYDIPDMGTEELTVGGNNCAVTSVWREIEDDLPYPVKRNQTGVTVNGFLFWHIDRCYFKQPPRGIICLDLKEEEFSVIRLPDSLDPALDDAFKLDALNGRELCLAAQTAPATVTMWTMSIGEGLNSQWERRYSIHVPGPFRPLAILPGSSSIILWKGGSTDLYRYELTTSALTTFCQMDRMKYQGRRDRKNLLCFNIRP